MRKTIIAALIILCSAVNTYGQNAGHKFEAGVGYAPFMLMTADDAQSVPYKCNAYLEWRYEFEKNAAGKSFDVGAKLDYKTFPTSVYDLSAVVYKGRQHGVILLAYGDLNLNPGGIINPYLGVSLGPGVLLNHWQSSEAVRPIERPDYPIMPAGVYPQFVVVASPRVGLELFRHLRLSASVDLSVPLSATRWPVCFNVGWTF